MKKLRSQFFYVKNIGVSQLEKKKKKEIIGWLQILLKFVFNENRPMQIFRSTRIGGCIFVYNNTATQWGCHNTATQWGCHTIFDYQIRGSQNIVEVPSGIYEPPIQTKMMLS